MSSSEIEYRLLKGTNDELMRKDGEQKTAAGECEEARENRYYSFGLERSVYQQGYSEIVFARSM